MCSVNLPNEPLWIEKEDIFVIHQQQLATHGGGMGVRDEGLLDSAIARPRQLFSYGDPHPTLIELAASYAYGLAKNHAFVDGNKRTAYVVCRTFLELNGLMLEATPVEKYKTFYGLAAGDVSEEELTKWLKKHVS